MKIVVATGTYQPEVSGQATFVFNLVNNLRRRNIDVAVVSYADENENNNQEKVYKIKRDKNRYMNYLRLLKMKAQDADIVYAQDLISSGLPAVLAKTKKFKLVVRIGGDFIWEKMVNNGRCSVPLSQYYQQKKNLKEKIYLFFYRFVLRRADKIIFNTDWQREIYFNFFKIPTAKTTVIENAFLGIGAADHEYKPENTSNEIIFAGRIIKLKNLARLIEAFKKIKTDKKLLIIGRGPRTAQLKILAQTDSRINFIDQMNQPELLDRVSRCYAVVVPSLSELSPNFALEALSLNRPVILTKENGLPLAIQKQCQLVDPTSVASIQEGLEKVLNQPWPNLISKKPTAVYDWPAAVQKHIEIFRGLIS